MHPDFKWFINDEQEKQILEAIGRAEKNTSGEIRVHLHKKTSGDILEQAVKTFKELGMDKTALRNGVLIFIDVDRRKFAVVGDEGIHQKVGSEFWGTIRDILQSHFKKEQYTGGLIQAIEEIGNQLKNYFPYQDDDINELPDDISVSN